MNEPKANELQKSSTQSAKSTGALYEVGLNLKMCAVNWEPEAHLIGNIKAGDLVAMARDYLHLRLQDGISDYDNYNQLSNKQYATIERTCAGPILYVGDMSVQSWLGTMYDSDADYFARQLNDEIAKYIQSAVETMRTVCNEAAAELTSIADELKLSSTVGGEWDGTEEAAKDEYDRLMSLVGRLRVSSKRVGGA